MSNSEQPKSTLRRQLRRLRRSLPEVTRRMLSARIAEHLLALPEVQSARLVALYAEAETACEVRTGDAHRLLTERGVTVAYPRVIGDHLELCVVPNRADLVPGFRGILEPPPNSPVATLSAVDVLCVPGLGFTATGDRLGQGGGYYDRLLADPSVRAQSVGLAFGLQLLQSVPTDPWDRPLDRVLTEDGPLP